MGRLLVRPSASDSSAKMAGERVYATLLLGDAYLPGALVLAHSLRDAGTAHELAVLVTLDSVSAHAVAQLKAVFDHVLPVPRIRNDRPANLHLMNRPDLHSAFTKINLWRQTQFAKMVYMDADVVAYRAPDELFDLPHAFAAAPDTGWPDIFNSGVMVVTPNMGDFYAMLAMAERGVSFDGADQGLLNMHFGPSFHRLPFTYNVTPSAHYQYLPAYRHFQSSINAVHFIGPGKPWLAGRDAPRSGSPYDEMLGRWWAVHDRHYRAKEPPLRQEPGAEPMPGPGPVSAHRESSSGPRQDRQAPDVLAGERQPPSRTPRAPSPAVAAYPSPRDSPAAPPPTAVSDVPAERRALESHGSQPPPPPSKTEQAPLPMSPWDASRQPPPRNSKPEAIDFPSAHYEMSRDTTPFVPPVRYPSPPRDMWYQVPATPPALPADTPPPIFPWEKKQPKPARSFGGQAPGASAAAQEPGSQAPGTQAPGTQALGTQTPGIQAPGTQAPGTQAPGTQAPGTQAPRTQTPGIQTPGIQAPGTQASETQAPGWRAAAQSTAKPGTVEVPPTAYRSEPQSPTTPSIKVIPSDPWTSFPRLNAWDDVPEIGRYVEGLQTHRRAKSHSAAIGGPKLADPSLAARGIARPPTLRLTDFPSEAERPSLPVTPAPVRRVSYWGMDASESGRDGRDSSSQPVPAPVPAAEGVPAQTEWDPAEQLQKLAKQQSEAILRRLAGAAGESGAGGPGREIPARPLPFGSDTAGPAAPVAPSAPPAVLSPQPVRGVAPAPAAGLGRGVGPRPDSPAGGPAHGGGRGTGAS